MQKWIESVVRRPFWLLLTIIAVTSVFIVGMGMNARLETNLDEYMPADHPDFVYNNEVEELFGLKSAVIIALESPTTIYTKETLQKLQDIVAALPVAFPELEGQKITSLVTAENITSDSEGLIVENFFSEPIETDEALQRLRSKVENNSMIDGRMVSIDGKSTLIVAELPDGVFDQEFYKRLQNFVSEKQGPETLYIAGRPVVEGELARLGPRDMAKMAPLVVILMAIILFILMRSVRDTLLSIFVVFIGTIVAFGAKSLLGIPIYSVDTMMPVMLIAIGVAYGIHMHNTFHHLAVADPKADRKTLVQKTLALMVKPVFMTALTTAVGFVSLITSSVLPVRYFGLFIALAVMVEMVLALLVFPVSVMVYGPPKKKAKETLDETGAPVAPGRVALVFGNFLNKRSGLVLAVGVLLVGVAAWGTGKVWIDTSFLANFQEDSNIVITDRFVNDNFGGTSSLYIVVDAAEPEVFKNPEALEFLDDVQREVLNIPLVGDSFGLPDFLKRMHRVMNGDNPEFEKIPESRDLVSQYLLLYEMSGDPDNLNRVVDWDYMSANLTFQLKSDSSALITKIQTSLESFNKRAEEMGFEIHLAGTGFKSYVFSHLLLDGQIWSLAASFLIVILLLGFMFKSIKIGLLGTIPIAITTVVNFGVMGLLGIPLSSATALISSIAVGIGVDYAIHLLEYYLGRRKSGDSIELAVRETLSHTGRAILFNAVTVIGGFGVLLFSVFPPNQQVGGLIALNMFVAALATLTVLLILVRFLDVRGKLIPKQESKDSEIEYLQGVEE